jgi:hypothetical protein
MFRMKIKFQTAALLILGLFGLIILGCSSRQDSVYKEKYVSVVFYVDNLTHSGTAGERTKRYLNSDTLYIIFESNFYADTVDLKINGKEKGTLILTTDASMGIADEVRFGNIESIETVQISKNNGPPLTIKLLDKEMYIWRVMYYKDTLEARWTKYLPRYD